jgi:hypothetical protein
MTNADQIIAGLEIFKKDCVPYVKYSTLGGECVMAVYRSEPSLEDQKTLIEMGWEYYDGDQCWYRT